MKKHEKRLKKKLRDSPPSTYVTSPYYFPTEQTDIVDKLNRKKMKKIRKYRLIK